MHSGAHNLEHLTKHASLAVGVRRSELREGDVLMLYTRNSVYTARFLGKGRFAVTGGWVGLNTGSPDEIAITGSTWAGQVYSSRVGGESRHASRVWKSRGHIRSPACGAHSSHFIKLKVSV